MIERANFRAPMRFKFQIGRSHSARSAFSVATGLWPSRTGTGGGYNFKSGFSLRVPLTDTTIYLDYLAARFLKASGEIHANVRFENLEEVDSKFDLVINCAGIGARELARDARSRAAPRSGRNRAENRWSFLRNCVR